MKRVTLLFWSAITFGFLVSPGVSIRLQMARGATFGAALWQLLGNLFEPGANEFLLAVIAALPFVGAAVFLRYHLGKEPSPKGRWVGGIVALCAGAALSLAGHIGIRSSVSSTAVVGYFFLPFEIAFLMAIGYLTGRLAAKLFPAHDTLLKP